MYYQVNMSSPVSLEWKHQRGIEKTDYGLERVGEGETKGEKARPKDEVGQMDIY